MVSSPAPGLKAPILGTFFMGLKAHAPSESPIYNCGDTKRMSFDSPRFSPKRRRPVAWDPDLAYPAMACTPPHIL
jgi:hypothetical protein